MALYSYKKKPTGKKKKFLTLISYSTMTIGALFLFWSFYPIVASEIYGYIFLKQDFVAPIPGTFAATTVDKANNVKGSSHTYSTNLADYTKASSWFVDIPEDSIHAYAADVTEYNISIPKLNIDDAKVQVGGEDLLNGLIQYLPESLPGSEGTVNIFGHSTHTSLYRRGNDYKSIFTFLPSLESGDVFHVDVDGVRYTYEIFDKKIIEPTEVAALTPKYDDSYVNLFTCYPPGTYRKRLQLKAKLKSLPL